MRRTPGTWVLGVWLVLTAVLIVGLERGTAARAAGPDVDGPTVTSRTCRPGFVHAVVGGKHRCLKAGQRCSRRRDRQYHRYGFHCHSGKLTRRKRKPPPALPPGVTAAVTLAGDAWALTAAPGSVWVQEGDTGVVRIDVHTNRITARVAQIANVTFADGELWGAAGNRLVRLEQGTGELVATIILPTQDARRVVAGEGALWVPADDTVLRVDRATGGVETIPVTCPGSREAAVGYGSLWIACKNSGTLLRIDASSRRVIATTMTGAGAHHVAIGAGAVWVTNYVENTVSRIDPVSNAAVAKIAGAGAGVGLTFENGTVWAATRAGVAKIDPATNAIAGRLTLPASTFYYGLAFAEGSLWVSATSSRRLYRIDPTSVRG